MDELVKALEKILERGIVMEDQGNGWRVRLVDESRSFRVESFEDDNNTSPTAQGGLTW